MTKAMQTAILTTVNAPYQTTLDAGELALAISKHNIKLAQVGSFLTETPIDAQVAFAEAHGISKATLEATATQFADWSGQAVALAA
ncbi:hypothetical protein [Cognatiyoonia sp. IB215182]|uniref:hypothetical protein n=1 Tax=Cognatiyoonia sp. IB215182 TaxID=3097353 RepID=UPI002A0E721A|nr:hypothetical protein [Cognatiyoonia sp. IB215182]MDX8355643.1 hypothetical protein [Cognatiyoonia sp. IB215182]